MKKILISGFEPFGGSAINPTERLINDIKNESFADAEIRTVLLPVHYDECAELLLKEVRTFEPDAVIACGVAGGRTAVTPERIAINTKDVPPESVIADNRGARPQDEPIDPEGPDGLFATLPIRAMVNRMKEAGIPAAVSNTAGTYICNNTMYAVLNEIRKRQLPILAGFVHFPASTEMALEKPGLPTLSHDTMLRALKVIVRTTIDELTE
ncbi:pyroglutamyl-peptidase I [Paenibacillus lactis]|uniref:Pyrrolidone-carboxylate peptidase n=1 Tax=Paenibacillus lactis TaxID=228574 RepID=A0ABS4FFI8_9BACL|nr:pyroglutamyl-peptidase I [Paenibacillus lactis]MBP1895010.1 pyroglutamyl-peptidase [Paenibacillus lactis]HAF96760.1 pyroglutamyl-peptidase I [Paenibacillus lactis]